MNMHSTGPRDRGNTSVSPIAATVWHQAREAFLAEQPPDGLEATLLARFGEVRRQQLPVASTPAAQMAPPSRGWSWARSITRPRPRPALAGAFSLCVVLAFSAPWWLQWLSATPESTTPFMLVSEPSGGALNVAQLVRVSVAREAMLDFGIPVAPQKLQEPVGAEMLLGQRGEVLAVRFIEARAKKRWSFD
jgi:hypothetical protein